MGLESTGVPIDAKDENQINLMNVKGPTGINII